MKVLLAIDGSPESGLALATASSLTWPPGSHLQIVSVVPTDAELFGAPWPAGAYVGSLPRRDELVDEHRRLVDQAAERFGRPGLRVTARVLEGRAASVILEEAKRGAVDLVIVGARGRGTLERVLLGSVSAELVDHATCPVLVARRPTAWRVLVATDGSSDAQLGVEFVGVSGLFEAAGARVLSVVDVPAVWWLGFRPGDPSFTTDAWTTVMDESDKRARETAAAAAARLRSEGTEAQSVVREGIAAAEIIDEAESWGADLVVVGTRGHGLLKRLILGSTARNVMHQAPMSVLVIRPAGAPRSTRQTIDTSEAAALA